MKTYKNIDEFIIDAFPIEHEKIITRKKTIIERQIEQLDDLFTQELEEALGNYEKAIEKHSQEILLNPNDARLYYNRGFFYNKKGDYDRAIEDYDQAIKLEPNYDKAYNGRAWIYAYHLKTNYDGALSDVNQAIRITPNEAVFLDTRGWVYLGIGDYEKALEDFEAALRIDPDNDTSKEGIEKIRQLQEKPK